MRHAGWDQGELDRRAARRAQWRWRSPRLHFYERQELIISRRTSGTSGATAATRCAGSRLIRVAQRVGIPLAEVTRRVWPSCRTTAPEPGGLVSDCPSAGMTSWRTGSATSSSCATTSPTASAAAACRWTGCRLTNPYDTLAEHGPGAEAAPRTLARPPLATT